MKRVKARKRERERERKSSRMPAKFRFQVEVEHRRNRFDSRLRNKKRIDTNGERMGWKTSRVQYSTAQYRLAGQCQARL